MLGSLLHFRQPQIDLVLGVQSKDEAGGKGEKKGMSSPSLSPFSL